MDKSGLQGKDNLLIECPCVMISAELNPFVFRTCAVEEPYFSSCSEEKNCILMWSLKSTLQVDAQSSLQNSIG